MMGTALVQTQGGMKMASIEFIQKRIEGKEKEIAKIEKKIERILKAKASNWENNPYYYDENDLKWANKDLEDAKKGLEKYRADLETAQSKANSRNVKVIIDFLENWKAKTRGFYVSMVPEYLEALEEYYRADRGYCNWFNYERRNATPEERKAKREEHDELRKAFASEWNWLAMYIEHEALNISKLDKDLKAEAERKYDFIIERTNKIVGEITDASDLHIKDAELNGIIIGKNGKAKVQTVGAGGWNIQRFHFRTLIHEAK